ncbi:MAG TPA: biotin/lipoyl-containing protein, partial [Candidatus Binataceae bacterium]|nr:biotin/lipoyl-containing protein [Candidatus Binataceae bacterium]
MSSDITMPKLSDTMEEGKIIRWLKRPGDTIRAGEVIAEVETDKADMVLEAFDDGVLEEIKLQEGETAPVGAIIATLRPLDAAARAAAATKAVEKEPEPKPVRRRARKEGPSAPSPVLPSAAAAAAEGAYAAPQFHPAMSAIQSAAPTAIPMPPRPPVRAAEPSPAPAPAAAVGEKLRASPLARRAAEEAGVDLSQVRGTGPEGRITKRDLDNYLRQE